jgi:hypothetical protein
MTEAIDYFSKGHPLSKIRSHFAWRARQKMFDRFMELFTPDENTSVLDLGVTPDTLLPESNHFEQVYPWPNRLTAASIEPIDHLCRRFPGVRCVKIEPGPMPFADKEFDVAFCSAVIEHVGGFDAQRTFIMELARVSRSIMFTTPNRWFPMEFHTILPLIHWFPRDAHRAILSSIGKEFWAKESNLNLLGADDIRRMAGADLTLHVESVKLFGWPSNLVCWSRS